MKLEVRLGKLTRQVEIQRTGPNQFAIGGEEESAQINAIEVAPNTYSILIDGRAFEAVVVPAPEGMRVRCRGQDFYATVLDPRSWRRERSAIFETEVQQRITAPMPGKVVRVLVSPGQTVEADQGLVVVEAMKMQNEIRAPRAGAVDRIFIREGQAVAAGEALVTIS